MLISVQAMQGETVPYIICVEKDSESNLSGVQKGLAERAHHPEEINAASNLAIDAEYYLTQQVCTCALACYCVMLSHYAVAWCYRMVFLHGVIAWCYCVVLLHGVIAWCCARCCCVVLLLHGAIA